MLAFDLLDRSCVLIFGQLLNIREQTILQDKRINPTKFCCLFFLSTGKEISTGENLLCILYSDEEIEDLFNEWIVTTLTTILEIQLHEWMYFGMYG
jgi:hypothetical protein